MIPPTVLALLKKWWPVLAAAALFGILLTLAYCEGRSTGKTGEVVKQQTRELKVQTKVGEANDGAAASRVADETRIALEEKELKDALDLTLDPDARRLIRGCIIMRQQGRDTTDIPACTRPAGRR